MVRLKVEWVILMMILFHSAVSSLQQNTGTYFKTFNFYGALLCK